MLIIAEYLFIENFLINYLILELVKIITRKKIKTRRLLLGGFISALYPFVFFIPSLHFLSKFFMKIILSIFIVKISFQEKVIRLLLKQLMAFYIVSFIFAGASLAIHYMTLENLNYMGDYQLAIKNFPIKKLILGIAFSGFIFYHIFSYYKERTKIEKELYNINIYYNSKKRSLVGLRDTGNSLTDPISKLPVLVVEYNKLKKILPKDLENIYAQGNELDICLLGDILDELKEKIQFKILPFKSIGNKNGLILAFKADFVEVELEVDYLVCHDLLIGIFNGSLSENKVFSGLINQEIFTRGNKDASKI